MALTLDATTLAAYTAASTADARAQAVIDALSGTVYVRVYNGAGTLMGEGTMAAPWATRSGSVITVAEVSTFGVLVTGTPDASGWYLRFEDGSGHWVRGPFGPGGNFTWSAPAWTAGQGGQIGTVTLNARGTIALVGAAIAQASAAGGLTVSGGGGGESIAHGASVTTPSGSYGTGPSLYIYDDFSTGTLGAVVANTAGIAGSSNTWDNMAGADHVYRSNAVSRGAHSRVAYHDLTGGSYVAALRKNGTFTGDWIFDWYERIGPLPDNSTPGWTRNFKLFRAYENGDSSGGNNYCFAYNGPGAPGASGAQLQYFTRNGNTYLDESTLAIPQDVWVRYTLRHRINQPYSGAEPFVFDRHVYGSVRQNVFTSVYRSSAMAYYPNEIALGDYWAHDSDAYFAANSGGLIYTSCPYIAQGWARVEWGNHATYASATITEIQRPTAWGSTITYVANKGLLSSGTNYEYIFDSSNTLVSTRAITVT